MNSVSSPCVDFIPTTSLQCVFLQNAPQGASSETNTSPTAGIPEVEALKAKVAELEAKNAALEAKDTLHKAKIAELEAKDALRNEENAALRQENARLKVSAENHVCTTLVPVCLREQRCVPRRSLVAVVASVRLHVDSKHDSLVT